MTPTPLQEFAETFRQEVLTRASVEDAQNFIEEAFVEIFTEYLASSGEIDDATCCAYLSSDRRARADAWVSDDDEGRLDLFIAVRSGEVPPTRLPRADVERAVRRVVEFLARARNGLYRNIDPSFPSYDMAAEIDRLGESLSRVRLFLLTDGLVSVRQLPEMESDGARISVQVWDMERLYRLATSGRGREPIHIDFEEQFGAPLPCLTGPATGEYRAFLTLIPGDILFQVYDEFGPRLLERNVRSFLQARGAVNQGIRDTIRREPGRFLAYNNGISATAESIEMASGSRPAIKSLDGLQIVNGAQTTASIHSAVRRDRADVSAIAVPAKIVIVPPEQLQEMVPKISLYANSQNRINQADFSANDPFHVRLEQLSRTVWAPSADGTQYQTHWFYERARGQYADEKARRVSLARQREFEREFPASQKFTKTDLAKFEHACEELPHFVSRGAQKNFVEFTDRLGSRIRSEPDVAFFQSVVARAILFTRTEKLVSLQRFGGYRANIVAYTIAYLMHTAPDVVDLSAIWRAQALSEPLEGFIVEIAHRVFGVLTQPPDGRNVTEWCKTVDCWDGMVRRLGASPIPRPDQLLPAAAPRHAAQDDRADGPIPDENTLVRLLATIDEDLWFSVASWGRKAATLSPSEAGLASALGLKKRRGLQPSPREAERAYRLLEKLETFGFEYNGAAPDRAS